LREAEDVVVVAVGADDDVLFLGGAGWVEWFVGVEWERIGFDVGA
jgi:hypothetical protein